MFNSGASFPTAFRPAPGTNEAYICIPFCIYPFREWAAGG